MIDIERAGAVAVVRLDRPRSRNALGSDLVGGLVDAFGRLDEDPGIGAIVLTGAAPGFCAGSDLKELAGSTVDEMVEAEEDVAALTRAIPSMGTPVVAAVEGFAIGGGFMLAVACDVVVSGASCRWHLSEVSLGWLPPWGFGPLLNRVGHARARQLTLASAPIDGGEAHGLGVADLVVADGAAEQRARSAAEALAALPRAAVASTKRLFAGLLDAAALDEHATALFQLDVRSPEARASLARYGVLHTEHPTDHRQEAAP